MGIELRAHVLQLRGHYKAAQKSTACGSSCCGLDAEKEEASQIILPTQG
jgi:hypothetical protein